MPTQTNFSMNNKNTTVFTQFFFFFLFIIQSTLQLCQKISAFMVNQIAEFIVATTFHIKLAIIQLFICFNQIIQCE